MIMTGKKIASRVALAVIAACMLLLGVMWIDHYRETSLPVPTGPFAVGRILAVWTDAAHFDPMAPAPGTHRELLAWIWYPAAPRRPGQGFADYLPAAWRAAEQQRRGPVLNFITRDLARVHAHSLLDAPLSAQQKSYPVVLLRGGSSSPVVRYTALAEDLASHGFVVVGIDAPYRTSLVVFPDGRRIAIAPQNNVESLLVEGEPPDGEALSLARKLVHAWSADLSFTLDQLQRLNASDPSGRLRGRLDMTRVGVFGHSLGGTTSVQFCHDDPRCKAAVDVDGDLGGSILADGVACPVLFLLSDHSREPVAETLPVMTAIRALYDRLPADQRLWIVLSGANHYMFSEDGALLKSPLIMHLLRAVGLLRIDGRRQLALSAHFINAFFDVYLRGGRASQLEAQPGYPEVEYVH